MTEAVADFIFGTATPAALGLGAIALIVTSFARGWIISRFTMETLLSGYKLLVEQANQRAEDWKSLYETEKIRADVLHDVAQKMTPLAETTAKILAALPTPSSRD